LIAKTASNQHFRPAASLVGIHKRPLRQILLRNSRLPCPPHVRIPSCRNPQSNRGSTNQENQDGRENGSDEILRDIQRRRNKAEQVRERATHANAQLKHGRGLEAKRAPSRADYATVVLGHFLLALSQPERHPLIQLMNEAVEKELELAGFDRDQIRIRLDRMCEDYENDLPEWRRRRAWLKDHKARLKRALTAPSADQALDA
jgi:hypothetical protein